MAEKLVPSLKSLSSFGFEERNLGCPRNLAGMSQVFEKLVQKKVRAHFSFPICGVFQTVVRVLFWRSNFQTDVWEGDATKNVSVDKGFFSEKGGGNSVRISKGNSVKRSGRFSEPPDSEN